MLWDIYPEELEVLTLHDAYLTLAGDPPSKIPFFVWLFENPRSPLALPGKIDLYQHDCLHLLLKKDSTPLVKPMSLDLPWVMTLIPIGFILCSSSLSLGFFTLAPIV